MFGFSGFGQSQPQQAPFGAAPTSPFGATAPAFGQPQQAASPFGTPPASGMFGAAQPQPAFGAASAPAFGASSAPAFGASTFGQQAARPATGFGGFGTPGFGASQPAFGTTSTFGQPSQPAFGITSAPSFGLAATTPAFGAAASAPAFGAASTTPSPFGAPSPFGGAFGAASTPAFGAASTPAFGAAPTASPFGATTPAFGAPATSSPFGAAPAAQQQQQQPTLFGAPGGFGTPTATGVAPSGTRAVPYQKTTDKDGTGQPGSSGAAAMATFISISAMPAYQNKSAEELRWEDYQQGVKSAAAGPPVAAAQPSPFGTPSPTAPFGAPAAAQAPFGAPATSSPFGAPGTSIFGASSAAPFGVASAPTFSPTTPSPFGTPAAGFGGQASQPAFGFGSTPAFGQTQAAPSIFGQTQPASAPAFGTGTSIFGSTPAFVSAPASSPIFSFSSAAAFTTSAPAATSSPFGTMPSPFGATTPSVFGATSAAAPAFGTTSAFAPSAFAPKPAASSPFGTSIFGATSAAAPAFGTTGAFTFASAGASAPSLFPTLGGATFGQPQQTSLVLAPFGATPTMGLGGAIPGAVQGQPPSVSQAPYGSFPQLPSVPEPKVGISARPARPSAAAQKGSPLLSLRTTPRVTAQPRNGKGGTTSLGALTSGGAAAEAAPESTGAPVVIHAHRLIIREPPPGTEAAVGRPLVAGALQPAEGQEEAGTALAAPERAAPPVEAAERQAAVAEADSTRANGHGERATAPASHERPPRNYLPQLRRLAAEGYYYEPSATQLEAMYKTDPKSIKHVSNFTVGRRDVGYIRWLKPVDVTAVPLDKIVTIQDGEVCLYGEGPKPPVGEGLNTDAEITLYNVYKMDKATGQPILKEGPKAIKWEKALRAMCAQLGAKFVSYKFDGGVWKFEVEHFSRYGLLKELEEEDESDVDVGEDSPDGAGKAAGGKERWTLVRYRAASSSGMTSSMDVHDTAGSPPDAAAMQGVDGPLQTISEGHGAVSDMDTEGGGVDSYGGPAAYAPTPSPLQHTLPAQLDLDPSSMLAMKESFFSPARHIEAEGLALLPGRSVARQGGVPQGVAGPTWHAWRRPPPPLTTTPEGTRSAQLQQFRQAVAPLGLPRPPPSAGIAAASPLAADATASGYFVDAGLSLGRSFRAGWGPNGLLVVPDGSVLRGSQQVTVKRMRVEGPDLSDSYGGDDEEVDDDSSSGSRQQRRAALRTRLVSMLQVHARHSQPGLPALSLDAAGPGQDPQHIADDVATPRWRLHSDRWLLGGLVEECCQTLQQEAGTAMAAAGGSGGGGGGSGGDMEALMLQHQLETWQLLQVLWGAVQAEQRGEEPAPGTPMESEEGTPRVQQLQRGALAEVGSETTEAPVSTALLARFQRQAQLSQWLQRQAKALVQEQLESARTPSEAALSLLTGRQLAAAAAVAAAAGDARLAMLISGATWQSTARADVAAQLEVWQQSNMQGLIEPDRLLIYQLLAGQVDGVQQRLGLDWRRFLGLLLWYCCQPASPPAEAVHMYRQALLENSHIAPFPTPLYGEAARNGRSYLLHSTSATDLQYELLQLWADTSDGGAEAGRPAYDANLPALLQAAGYSPNPLDASQAWHVMTTLQAIAVLPDAEGNSTKDGGAAVPYPEYLAASFNLITQLQLVGGVPEWAVYVAMHLPDHPGWPGLRHHQVSELLTQHCPEWAADDAKVEFLTQTLGLPPAMLANAQATWAAYRCDDQEQCQALLAAGRWQEAHQCCINGVAPALFLRNRFEELSVLVERMEGHAPEIPNWETGGGLYACYMLLSAADASQGVSAADRFKQCHELSIRLQAAAEALRQQRQQLMQPGDSASAGSSSGSGSSQRKWLQQQLVLSRMAQQLHRTELSCWPLAAKSGADIPAAMQDNLAVSCLGSELRLPSIAVAASEVAAAVLAQ